MGDEINRGGKAYLHDDDGLLNDVADPGGDEVEKNIYASLSRCVNLDSRLPDSLDTSPHKVDVHLRRIPANATQPNQSVQPPTKSRRNRAKMKYGMDERTP